MPRVNSFEKKFERLGRPSIKERYMTLLEDVQNCQHEYSLPVYDPEEIIFFGEKRDRWYADCKKCGTRKYAYEKALFLKK